MRIIILALLINAGLACIPAKMAKNKGYNFVGFWCLGFLVSFFIGILVTACITDKNGSTEQNKLQETDVFVKPYGFLNTYLGFLISGALLVIVMILAFSNRYFLMIGNLDGIMKEMPLYLVFAFAVSLPVRVKGPDMSIGAVMALSSVIISKTMIFSGSWASGFLLAVAVCAVIGIINGVFSIYLRIPAIIVTLIISLIVTGISYALTNSSIIQLQSSLLDQLDSSNIQYIVLPVAALIMAILISMISKLNIEKNSNSDIKDGKIMHIAVYTASSIIGAIAGLMMLSNNRIAVPAAGADFTLLILFIFACILSSRVLDYRYLPVFYATVPALIWCLLGNVLTLMDIANPIRLIVFGAITLLLVVTAYIARSKELKDTLFAR